MAQQARPRRVARDYKEKSQRKAIWEKCGAASRLEKRAINGKIRDAAAKYGYPLRKSWGSFDGKVRAALTYQVRRDLELGARYGLSKNDVELMLRTICRNHGRNKGAAKRKALKKAAGAGGDNSDGDYLPSDRQSPAPPASGSRQQSPIDPTPPPPPRTPTDPAPPSGTAASPSPCQTMSRDRAPTDTIEPTDGELAAPPDKVRPLSTLYFLACSSFNPFYLPVAACPPSPPAT